MQTLIYIKVIVRQATTVIAEHLATKVETQNGNTGNYVTGVDKDTGAFSYDYATYTFELSIAEVQVSPP